MRDKTLTRLGLIRPEDLSLNVEDQFNNVGSWKLTLASEHALAESLRVPGAGVIITGPADVLMSGPVVTSEYAATPEDRRGSIVFSGVSDSVILADMLAWPEPANPDATTQATGHDTRAGVAETLMHAYVNANCGPAAPAGRRRAGLTMGPDSGRGPIITKSARFPTLGELLTEIAAVADLGFRIVQRGASLVFETYQITDRTREVRLDVLNGTLAGQRVAVSPPGATRVIVAGQGELEDRTFVAVDNAASTAAENAWGRRIERFVDQRNTDDHAELTQAGNEVLAEEGDTSTAVQAVPVEDSAMEFGRDWGLGDRVTVVAGGQELTAPVTGMVLKADDSGFQVGALLGDATGFDPNAATASRVQSTESRVSALERTAEASPAGARFLIPADYVQSTPPANYPDGESVLFLSSAEASAGGWDFGGKTGFLTTRKWPNGDARQWWSRVHANVTSHEEWVRGGNAATGWSPWRRVAFEDNRARGIVVLKQNLPTTAYIGDTETIVYSQAFTAETGRCYKITLCVSSVDKDSAGDNADDNLRYPRQSGVTTCRAATAGATLSTSSPSLGSIFTTVVDDDSQSASGVCAAWYLNNPAPGTCTVGISLYAKRPAATYGSVRYIAYGNQQLAVEDVGPAV